jgi:hypothetical protein
LYETSLERNSLAVGRENDADRDGIPDSSDTCPTVDYEPGFD